MPRINRSTSDSTLSASPVFAPPRGTFRINVLPAPSSASVDDWVYRLSPVPQTIGQPCPFPDRIITLSFLAEGAANTVFKIHPYIEGQSPPKGPREKFYMLDRHFHFGQAKPLPHEKVQGKVLRISKGVPKTLPFKDIVHGFNTVIRPLFKTTEEEEVEERVSPEKGAVKSCGMTNGSSKVEIKIRRPGLSAKELASRRNGVAHGRTTCTATKTTASKSFDSFLMDDEGVDFNSSVAWHLHTLMHGYDCDETTCERVPDMELRGILLPDMSSVADQFLTVELKPKWLAQSPTAPRDAFKCRTCALQARRMSMGKSPPTSYICPLQLVSGDEKAIKTFLKPRILEEMKKTTKSDIESLPMSAHVESVLERATEYLAKGPGHDLLQFLHKLQTEHDSMGVTERPRQGSEEFDQKLRVAMTLRDCSLFIRVPYREADGHIEGKLGDLDYKSPDKIKDWKMKETALINGGWYTKLDKAVGGEDNCAIAEAWRKDCPWYV